MHTRRCGRKTTWRPGHTQLAGEKSRPWARGRLRAGEGSVEVSGKGLQGKRRKRTGYAGCSASGDKYFWAQQSPPPRGCPCHHPMPPIGLRGELGAPKFTPTSTHTTPLLWETRPVNAQQKRKKPDSPTHMAMDDSKTQFCHAKSQVGARKHRIIVCNYSLFPCLVAARHQGKIHSSGAQATHGLF